MSVGTQAGPYLLRAADQSSICLNCHQGDQGGNTRSFTVATPDASMPVGTAPNNYTPGGDFGWLKKTYTWIPRSGAPTETSKGERHGHSIIAADYGYAADTTHVTAPGGDAFLYPANKMHCTSCHDPHGRYRLNADNGVFTTTGKPIYSSGSYGTAPTSWGAVGAYRLLGGIGYQPKSLSGSYAFALGGPIVAVTPVDYNAPEVEGSNQVIVAYGKNGSLWCANCHALMHTTWGTIVHAVDVPMASTITSIYNSYRKSGDLTGSSATAYLSLAPFQHDNVASIATLRNDVGQTAGPLASTDRVTCLSCHRAHASGFDSIMRFGLGNEFITVADSAGTPLWPDPAANPAQAMGRTAAETQASYYGRPASQCVCALSEGSL